MCSVSPSPDAEINAARKRNDLLLKTRWESIFERYEKDFTGIGDEVGFATDDIIVDNGHLRSMQSQKDTGAGSIQEKQGTASDGRRLLRAMTVAPSECVSSTPEVEEVEEVLQSIETMAEDTFLNDYLSDDELFNPNPELTMQYEVDTEDPEDLSEVDSLFDARPNRSPSVDALFDPTPRDTIAGHSKIPLPFSVTGNDTNYQPLAYRTPSERDVLQRHKSLIREEVRNILNEHKEKEEAKLEPAWRIPVRLSFSSHTPQCSTSPNAVSVHRSHLSSRVGVSNFERLEDENTKDENKEEELEDSIWRPAKRTRRPRKVVMAAKNLRRIRAESEDPLQEGFSSDAESSSRRSSTKSQLVLPTKTARLPSMLDSADEEDIREEMNTAMIEADKVNMCTVSSSEECFTVKHRATPHSNDQDQIPSVAPEFAIISKVDKNMLDTSNIDLAEKMRVVGRATQENSCEYCQHQYPSSGSVGHHWNLILNDCFHGHLPSDDSHNIPILWSLRFTIKQGSQLRKLKVKDFRTLVELHEGSGLSFDHIAKGKTLWTAMTGDELTEEYEKFRRFTESDIPSKHQYPFTDQDKKRMFEILEKSPEITLHGLVRVVGRLVKRPNSPPSLTGLDLGHYLADVFLAHFRRTHPKRRKAKQSALLPVPERSHDQTHYTTQRLAHERQYVQPMAKMQHEDHEQDIKVESDDELFCPR